MQQWYLVGYVDEFGQVGCVVLVVVGQVSWFDVMCVGYVQVLCFGVYGCDEGFQVVGIVVVQCVGGLVFVGY